MKTRQPTGRPAFPLVLVEGQEKAGKSYLLAQLAASPMVDRMFVWDLGDGTMDEYASLGPYEIVETDGTYTSLVDSLREAVAIPPAPGKVNAYGIDSGTDLWDLLKRWADHRARNSKSGRKALADDPDAAVDVSMNLWTDAKERWSTVVNILRRAPGIGVITAQGDEVTEVVNGVPTRGRTWSINAEKTAASSVNAWVRLQRDPRRASLVGLRRLGVAVDTGGMSLPLQDTLHHVVFDVMGGAEGFSTLAVAPPALELSQREAQVRLLDAVRLASPDLTDDEAKDRARTIWGAQERPDEIGPDLMADLVAQAQVNQ